jgi:2'-deoxynucleoside 5'-phosphate N-hydrolase
MKVYFACSITGEGGGKEEKEFIVKTLKDLGCDVLSEIFTTEDPNKGHNTPEDIYRRDISWVIEADLMVADVSRISLGVGYEIGWKAKSGGRVLVLVREDRFKTLSNMIKGVTEENFVLKVWKDFVELKKILKSEINK